ncbi:porin [Rubrivivax sp. RP6-9]|uniref:porin n=1 Tax=Rubrivivax sp. RP6-9 TaxID=3415750 RepID=UPI003CC65E19
MQRTLMAAAAALLATGSAFAQSSVTIYGRANVTVESLDRDGVKTTELVNNASRLGFKGTEDLGGGLKANFVLEHRFSIDTGIPASTFWAGQSEVNLESATFGTLRLGQFTSEAYYATADYISMHNHDTGTSSDALYAYLGRDTNKIAYRLPTLVKGLQLEGAVSMAEGSANLRTYDFAANYQLGSLALGAGYQKFGDDNQFAVRALYEVGSFVFGAYVQQNEDVSNGRGDRTTFRLSGAYNLGASEFHLNFGAADDYSNVANSDAQQFTLGYNYNLSKRTKVYAFYTEVADGSAKVYGGDFSSIAVGVRHNF